MHLFVVALHVLLCLFLILIIILQPGKGGDVGAAFGSGGSSAVFGPRGPTGILQRATTIVAVLFMATSITLALQSSRSKDTSADDAMKKILEQRKKEAQEIEEAPEAPSVP